MYQKILINVIPEVVEGVPVGFYPADVLSDRVLPNLNTQELEQGIVYLGSSRPPSHDTQNELEQVLWVLPVVPKVPFCLGKVRSVVGKRRDEDGEAQSLLLSENVCVGTCGGGAQVITHTVTGKVLDDLELPFLKVVVSTKDWD